MKVNHYIYSGARGSYGGVVEQKWKDKNILRTKPTSVENPNTVAQQFQRAKFSAMQALSRILSVVFSIGLKSMTSSMTAYNAFMKVNLKTALTGSTPQDVAIDYPNLVLAKGPSFPLQTVTVTDNPSLHKLEVDWVQPAGPAVPAGSPVYIAAVHPDHGLLAFVEDVIDAAQPTLIDYSSFPSGKVDLHLYIFYTNGGTNQSSDSFYFTL